MRSTTFKGAALVWAALALAPFGLEGQETTTPLADLVALAREGNPEILAARRAAAAAGARVPPGPERKAESPSDRPRKT